MYSPSIERALRAAVDARDRQVRAGLVPESRSVHPFHVAMMLARWGLEEDVIVAGLMSGVASNGYGWESERLVDEFGSHVAALVGELAGAETDAAQRVEHVARLSPSAAAIQAATELHRLQNLLAELREADNPAAVWASTEEGCAGTLAHSGRLVEALAARVEPKLARALNAAQRALVEHVERTGPTGIVRAS